MIGIECRWECPACGNILTTQSPFWDEKVRKNVAGPQKCGCGRKGNFKLLDLKRCSFTVLPEDTKIVDKDGKTIYSNIDEVEAAQSNDYCDDEVDDCESPEEPGDSAE